MDSERFSVSEVLYIILEDTQIFQRGPYYAYRACIKNAR